MQADGKRGAEQQHRRHDDREADEREVREVVADEPRDRGPAVAMRPGIRGSTPNESSDASAIPPSMTPSASSQSRSGRRRSHGATR